VAREGSLDAFPVLTLGIAGAAVLAMAWPSLAELLVYDRQAVLNGELWRLLTAPLVHFSLSHLSWNLLVFVAAGWSVEKAAAGGFRRVCGLAAVFAGLAFLWGAPELGRYAGLSGLATGAVSYLCLCKFKTHDKPPLFWAILLLLVAGKILAEVVTGHALFVSADASFSVLPAAHFWGLVAALLTGLGGRFRRQPGAAFARR
jgi:rhomboid family GlyGly-CTERM serine protease